MHLVVDNSNNLLNYQDLAKSESLKANLLKSLAVITIVATTILMVGGTTALAITLYPISLPLAFFACTTVFSAGTIVYSALIRKGVHHFKTKGEECLRKAEIYKGYHKKIETLRPLDYCLKDSREAQAARMFCGIKKFWEEEINEAKRDLAALKDKITPDLKEKEKIPLSYSIRVIEEVRLIPAKFHLAYMQYALSHQLEDIPEETAFGSFSDIPDQLAHLSHKDLASQVPELNIEKPFFKSPNGTVQLTVKELKSMTWQQIQKRVFERQ